jgi:hypothetical protein
VFQTLKPDGRFLFNVPDRIENNDLTFIVHKTLMKMFPEDPAMFIERTPMAYHDIGNIRGELAGAGFTLEHRRYPPDALSHALGAAPGARAHPRIAARGRGHCTRPFGARKAVEAATRAIGERFGPGPIEASMQAHIVTAA